MSASVHDHGWHCSGLDVLERLHVVVVRQLGWVVAMWSRAIALDTLLPERSKREAMAQLGSST